MCLWSRNKITNSIILLSNKGVGLWHLLRKAYPLFGCCENQGTRYWSEAIVQLIQWPSVECAILLWIFSFPVFSRRPNRGLGFTKGKYRLQRLYIYIKKKKIITKEIEYNQKEIRGTPTWRFFCVTKPSEELAHERISWSLDFLRNLKVGGIKRRRFVGWLTNGVVLKKVAVCNGKTEQVWDKLQKGINIWHFFLRKNLNKMHENINICKHKDNLVVF